MALLAGCGSGPQQSSSAAIVGDQAIDLGAVQHEIQWMLDNVPQAKQAQDQRKFGQISQSIVLGKVRHELLNVAAQRAGIRVDQREVTQLVDSIGGVQEAAKANGVIPERVHEIAADTLMVQQLGKHNLNRVSVSFIGAQVTAERPGATAKDQAMDLGRKIAADPSKAQQFITDAGQEPIDQAPLPLSEAVQRAPELSISPLYGTRAGSVVVFQPSQESTGWMVALIKDRQDKPVAAAEPAGDAAEPKVLRLVGQRMLQPIADELGVRVNPRYGVWDATGVTVAANENEVTGHQFGSRTVTP